MVIAMVLGVAGSIVGTQSGGVAQLPFSASWLTIAGVGSAIAVLVVTFIRALLGGLTSRAVPPPCRPGGAAT